MTRRRTTRSRLLGALATLALTAATVAVGPSSPAFAVPGGITAAPPLHCTGDGTNGNRVQMVYAYEAGTPNRFAEREPIIRLAAWVAQQNVNDSARREGAQRWLRFVTSATGCQLTILTIQVPAGSSNAYFVDWRNTLKAAGLNASNRIYGVFAENLNNACAYTDSGDLPEDDSPGTANTHNNHPAWMSFSPGCFGGQSLVHENTHAFGAMSGAMPHSDGGGHCTDGIETLCGAGALTVVCPDPLAARLLDCGRDDYFAINPQGSFLPTHWNVALHSLYLEAGTATTTQTVPQPLPPQLLHALDVEGTSIAFAWTPTVQPEGSGYTLEYQLLRNGTVVATTPAWKSYARVTGLAQNSSASYTVRTRFTYSGAVRTSGSSTALSVTTNSSGAQAGGAEDGATMFLANDLLDPNGKSLVMDLFNFDTSDNAVIKQWDQTSADNQRWKMTAATGGAFTLTNQYSGKCLSTLGGSTAVGTAIVSITCNGAATQQWTFTPISSGVTYQIRTSAGTCIGAQGNGTSVGTDLVLATCSTSEPTQRWTTNRIA